MIQPNYRANYVDDGIDSPNLVKMDLGYRDAMYPCLRLGKAFEDEHAPFLYMPVKTAFLDQIENII
jgi:hypothetical protein